MAAQLSTRRQPPGWYNEFIGEQQDPARPRRVRWTLLVLLWIWAACVFVFVDLFWNVAEFDRMRPRSGLYDGMRRAAHEMVGTRLPGDGDEEFARRPDQVTPAELETELQAFLQVRELAEQRSFDGLRGLARAGTDPRVRIRALRQLAKLFGHGARPTLFQSAQNPRESEKVREEAARLVGQTGDGALQALEQLIAADLPDEVRAGAVLGLAELRTGAAAERALALADGPPTLRAAALQAVSRLTGEEATRVLVAAVEDRKRSVAARVAICRALAFSTTGAGAGPLARVLDDPDTPAELRAAATDALASASRIEVRELERAGAVAELRAYVRDGITPHVRVAALRGLTKVSGPDARDILLLTVRNDSEDKTVRREAALLLGRTGEDALRLLDGLITSEAPDGVKAGAILGLAEVGTAAAAERALALADAPGVRAAALEAIGRFTREEAVGVLFGAVRDERRAIEARAAACIALANARYAGAVGQLINVLEDSASPPSLRTAAVAALGTFGGADALAAVIVACEDPSPEVARRAQAAKKRLERDGSR